MLLDIFYRSANDKNYSIFMTRLLDFLCFFPKQFTAEAFNQHPNR